ncbi:MAG: toll/interleukin-1 receptor domain-containing protein [Candidatus Eremiobacteraeota bacterium]|nr:toll/interleukin-1 receptor domain-containing protein [Candidatus Eremiobacteraeota bacterium]
MKDFLVSYNKSDLFWANWTGWHLEDAGYTVEIKPWEIKRGTDFSSEMENGSKKAKFMIAVLTPAYLRNLSTNSASMLAFSRESSGEAGKLIPVCVRKCELKGLMSKIDYINLVGLDENGARNALFKGLESRHPGPKRKLEKEKRTIKERPQFPGGVPEIRNITYGRNPNFTGRENLLMQIRTSLLSDGPVVLNGPDGMGKTEVAIRYIYDFKSDYDLVWLIRSDKIPVLEDEYAVLADKLNLPEAGSENLWEIVSAVKSWLEHKPGWLLLFDNAVGPAQVKEYIPEKAMGHVLITSAGPGWSDKAQAIPISAFYCDDAVNFLQKRTGRLEEEEAAKLAQELGFFPLALELAGAHISDTDTSFAKYLKMYRNCLKKIVNRFKPSSRYPITVAATWEVLIQLIGEVSPEAVELLNICAFFAPDNISLEDMKKAAKSLPKSLENTMKKTKTLDTAMATLRRFYIIKESKDTLSLNSLIQSVIRDCLPADEKSKLAETAVRILNETFPADCEDEKSWGECSRLLPHVLDSTIYAEKFKADPKIISQLLNRVVSYLKRRGNIERKKDILERLIKNPKWVKALPFGGFG